MSEFALWEEPLMLQAQEEARALGHDWVGTEHLLLGALRTNDAAPRILSDAGFRFIKVLGAVIDLVGEGRTRSDIQPADLTPDAKHVIGHAMHAGAMRTPFVTRVLLAILNQNECLGAQAIVNLGGDLHELRDEINVALGGKAVSLWPDKRDLVDRERPAHARTLRATDA